MKQLPKRGRRQPFTLDLAEVEDARRTPIGRDMSRECRGHHAAVHHTRRCWSLDNDTFAGLHA
jgi:hypothetical protein